MNFADSENERAQRRGFPFAIPRDSPSAPFVDLKDSMLSQPEAVTPFVRRLMRLLATFTGDKSAQADIEIALREAVLNGITHGNKNNPEKRVYVTCRCGIDGDISLAIRDEGAGFHSTQINGRGLRLMRALMDDVSFADGGTVVHMRKAACSLNSPRPPLLAPPVVTCLNDDRR